MLAGAWGARAGELLERVSERRGASIHRVGALTMLNAPQRVAGSWCCWLFGEPRDRGTLAARFGLLPGGDLPSAFARALTELGEAACELLDGRFVVVTLDRDRGRCKVTRDQLGAQPLVHTRAAGGVLFAEHERDLLDLLQCTPGPDRLALLQWIENGYIPLRRTLYEGIQRLPAGHRLILDETDESIERWWNLRYAGVEKGDAEELGERLREAAFTAVSRAAAGAQRPAVKLSGGMDSACVAAGLAGNSFAAGRALAIGGAFASYPAADESDLIEATARHTHLPLELVAFDPASSMLAPALAHIARWRLPPATPNLFLWQPVTARARDLGVDVMIDGEGGDELFGLAPYLIADMLRAGKLPRAWSLTARVPGIGLHPRMSARMRVLRRYGLSPLRPRPLRHHREAQARRAASSRSLVPDADAQVLAELEMANEADRRDGPAWWRFQVQNTIDLRDLLDVGSHFRREAIDERIDERHPFLYDLRLIEAALRLPPQAQFDPVRDRPLLRDALIDLIPEAVRTRHVKSHFTSLVLAGIRADESGLIEPLRQSGAPIRAYVAQDALERKLEGSPDERPFLGAGTLWRVAIADRWIAAQADESM